jgi:hypothetical protein
MNANHSSLKEKQTQFNRIEIFAFVALVCVLATILFNNVLSYIDPKTGDWTSPLLLPVMKPLGNDFRVGLYRPGMDFLEGKNPFLESQLIYPPFVVLAALPFQLTSEWRAYLLQLALIFILNLGALYLLARSAVHAFLDNLASSSTSIFIIALITIAVTSFSSYGFMFNIERGNFDTYPLFLSALFLWLLWKFPDRVWIQVLVISAAAHLKVYPLIFYSLVIWKHGWKGLLTLAVVNLGMLFCLGSENARAFIDVIFLQASSRPSTWIGNHSAYAYASFWQWTPEAGPGYLEYVFLGLPILLWAGTAIILVRRGYSFRNAVWLFIVSVPLVNLIPRVSYDYKLVWVYVPAIVLLVYQMGKFFQEGKKRIILLWLFLAALLLMMSRSCGVTPDILASKYPYILILLVLSSGTAILDGRLAQQAG